MTSNSRFWSSLTTMGFDVRAIAEDTTILVYELINYYTSDWIQGDHSPKDWEVSWRVQKVIDNE